METFKMLFGVGVIIALLGLNVATADINGSAGASLTFPLDIGDGTASMPDVTFDAGGGAGGDESQTTCAMTPGGPSTNPLLQEPVVPPTDPETLTSTPLERHANDSLRSPPPSNGDRGRVPAYPPGTTTPPGEDPPGEDEPPPPPPTAVPEPATLVIVGLGLGAALVARRRRKS